MHTLPSAPSATELVQSGPLQQRSLSLPLSRIVLNPQDFVSDASEVEQNCDSTLPLGLGYYAFDKAIAVPRFLSFCRPVAGSGDAPAPVSVPVGTWVADEGARCEVDGSSIALSLRDDATGIVGTAAVDVEVDPARPVLRICVREVEGQWTLQLRDGATEPIHLLHGSAISGLRFIDVRAFLPAEPAGEFRLTLGVVGEGGHGGRVVIDELAFVAPFEVGPAGVEEFAVDWSPVGLGVTARDGELRIEGGETFVTPDSFVRELRLSGPVPGGSPLTVVGRHLAPPAYDTEGRLVALASDGMVAAVSIPDGAGIRFYPDEAALAAGAPGADEPAGPVGIWAVRLAPGNSVYRVGVGLDPRELANARDRAQQAALASEEERRRHWAEHWDALLAQAPHPENFEIRSVDAGGLAAAEVRSGYYSAFVGLLSNVLPPQPELPYLYPTVATGKGSMWNHGTAGARSAAAWETFLAIQFLAYVEPGLAWGSFQGLMSRVDAEGSLGGESLPSRKAQTAAVLFALTGDREALAASYPGLKRLLLWQAARPRWIYGTYDFDGEQDAEFLTSLIIDLRFGSAIADDLGLPGDAAQFDGLREQLSRDYREHCFIGAERAAVQHWFPGDETAELRGGPAGFGLQVASGLAVPGIADWQRDSLLTRFDAQFDATDQLGGFDFVKHPNVSHTVAGLIAHGRAAEALALVNALLRDVIRSGSFAEVYDRGPERPRPWGVRPSIFGMTQVIDAVWLNNGMRMDLGAPQPGSLPGADGAVHNIRMRGAAITLASHPLTL